MYQPHPQSKAAYKLLHDGVLALGRAEQRGIRLDLKYCHAETERLTREIKALEQAFHQTKFYRHWFKTLGGRTPNINSNAQLGNFLYKRKKLKPIKTTVTGQGSTDEEALLQLNIPELNDLLRLRGLKKIRDTYLKGFLKEQVGGRVHPNFNLHIARTYRSSSDRPNFQNIPKRDEEAKRICRQALFPSKGYQLMAVDYSGIEVCVSACYHQDPTMMKYIKDPKSDMHRDMAQQVYELKTYDPSITGHKVLRSAAKNGFVFPQFYGDYYRNCAISMACNWGKLPDGRWKPGQGIPLGDGSLSDHLLGQGHKSLEQFADHVQRIEKDFWGRRFRVYARWKEKTWEQYQRTGYVELLTGFRCGGLMAYNDVTNYPIQGAAFHCLLKAFVLADRELRARKFKTRLIGQIHDEMILDVWPPELDEVGELLLDVMTQQVPEEWPWIVVPLTVDMEVSPVDGSWQEMGSYVRDARK